MRSLNVKGQSDFTRSTIEDLTEKAQKLGAKGMAWIAYRPDGEIYSILTKYFSKEEMQELLDKVEAKPGDFILFSADKFDVVCRFLFCAGAVFFALRHKCADKRKLFKLLYVNLARGVRHHAGSLFVFGEGYNLS